MTDKDDNVCIYWASYQGFRCHIAFAKEAYQRWVTLPMTDARFTFQDACKHDRWRLAADGVLSFCGETDEGGGQKGFAIVDFEINRLVEKARTL